MANNIQAYQWLSGVFKVAFGRSTARQKPLFGLLFASSAFLVLALPTITDLPGSKILAQNLVSQDLEAASFFQQGVMRYNRQDLQGAEFAFRKALQRDGNIGAARNYLGNILMQQNRLDLAVQEYGEAVRLSPNLGEAYYNLGLALQRQEQKEAAITAYRQSLVVNPTMAAAHYNLGLLLQQQGQLEDAIASYQQAINLDSSNANAYFNLAIALQREGKIESAIAAYRQVLKLDPENALAYNNLGSLMVIQGQASGAISLYQQAIRQNPKTASAYYNLGVTLYNQGDLKTASRALNRASKVYREQGNIEQVEKVDQLIQQIDQQRAKKPPQASQTVILVAPVTVEQQPTQLTVPNATLDKTDTNDQ
ncbi:tetratricopeptide repeat protein [Cylindrospermum sp. FACHB-282]|uniref:tetratricopeptide repeat protein n=1 Tax=Cylindrospermum sp. FACHB-282 TaxID=2692794 RepID=UPI001688A6DD|nr:tetratricopeptide repeat protein [Cylindrospermum sp. FACHB-282]MBD2384124.1 tetratricopeptide repeat protein [Cylindrospermum sp. FACHB-282]